MAKINKKSLISIMNNKVAPIANRELSNRIRKSVDSAQEQMMEEFNMHPVTQEIEGGPNGYNQSGTLGGYGNLFSYIGFEEGMSPTEPLRRVLKKILKIRAVPANHKSMVMKFLVEIPSKEELFAAAPMPWANGRSWAEGIEKGISGLGQYLNTTSFVSRSGEGVQAKNQIRSGKFLNTKYLSSILNNLKRNIRQGIK